MLYFNTTDNVMKVYTGSAWVAAYVSGTGFASLSGADFTGAITAPSINLASTTLVNSILDEDNMASNSATALSTQQAIKSYVDTQVATVPVGDITAVTAGTGLSGGGTSGAVTLDIDSTVATLTGTQTLTNKTLGATSVAGNLTFTGTQTVDGRDVSVDGTKLDTIETNADVTDTANVTAAGAAMLTGATFTGNVTAPDFIGPLNGAIQFTAINRSGGTINKGQAIYISGISGNTPEVGLADASNASTMPAFGLAGSTATDNNNLEVITFGSVHGIQTNYTGWALGDTLYISTTAGILTNVPPTGEASKIQNIGLVERLHSSNGTIKVGGAGRTNATPNLNDGNVFIGNASNQAAARALQIADTTGLQTALDGKTAYSNSDVDTHLNTSTASASEVLSWTGSDYDWVAQSGGGGGADLYAANEISPTAQPSATGNNAIAIGDGADSSGTNSIAIGFNSESTGSQNVALGAGKATGTLGSLSLGGFGSGYSQASDSWAVAIGRSLASGNTSLAMNITDNTSSYGATGANSIAMGYLAKSTNSQSVAISGNTTTASGIQATSIGGENNTASGTRATALGGSTNYATGQESYAFGNRASAKEIGKYSYGGYFGFSGTFSGGFGVGGSQGGMMVLGAATTDATPTVLRTNTSAAGSTNQLVAFTDTCIMFSGTVVAMQNGAQDQGGWEIKGLLKNDGGTTTLVSSNIQTFADGNGWTVGLTADNTNNALAITCTGEAAHNIRWVANISTSEVTYA